MRVSVDNPNGGQNGGCQTHSQTKRRRRWVPGHASPSTLVRVLGNGGASSPVRPLACLDVIPVGMRLRAGVGRNRQCHGLTNRSSPGEWLSGSSKGTRAPERFPLLLPGLAGVPRVHEPPLPCSFGSSIEAALEPVKLFECIADGSRDLGGRSAVQTFSLDSRAPAAAFRKVRLRLRRLDFGPCREHRAGTGHMPQLDRPTPPLTPLRRLALRRVTK
jgi:hypothetical protein